MTMIISLLPPLVFLLMVNYFTSKDKTTKFSILSCLIIGTFIVLPIAILEARAMPTGLPTSTLGIFISNFLVVAPAEEIGKLLIVYYIMKYGVKSKKPINIIACAVAGSMGFAMIENIVYVAEGGVSTGILRAVSSVPMHASTAIVIGLFGAKEIINGDTNGWIKGYLIAILMHGGYNAYAMLFNDSFLFAGVFVISMLYVYLSYMIIDKSVKWTKEIDEIEMPPKLEIENSTDLEVEDVRHTDNTIDEENN